MQIFHWFSFPITTPLYPPSLWEDEVSVPSTDCCWGAPNLIIWSSGRSYIAHTLISSCWSANKTCQQPYPDIGWLFKLPFHTWQTKSPRSHNTQLMTSLIMDQDAKPARLMTKWFTNYRMRGLTITLLAAKCTIQCGKMLKCLLQNGSHP